MKHIYQIEKTDNACAAFGRFDGMHRGHRSVVQTLVREAKSRAVPSVLVSFVPPEGTFVYTSEEEKALLTVKRFLCRCWMRPLNGATSMLFRVCADVRI